MSEQELKLHVPASARRDVLREVQQRNATRIHLHALYFDTPTRELARARIALRLRKEGENWVQTLKMPGADAITRIELNHPRPGPELDLSVYAGTEFEAPLSSLQGKPEVRYETDVERLLRNVDSRHGTIELAYDTGVLRTASLELPIFELEFELISGQPAAIFSVARRWQQRHGLVLDARSKSERGDALASLAQTLTEIDAANDSETAQSLRSKAIARFWAPCGASPEKLREDMTPPQAMGHIAGECLDQIARNAAILAEVDTLGIYPAGNSEHVHQLRVGMRRLRSAWRLFDGWIAPPPASVQTGIRKLFIAFGENRDQDVLNETVTPVLEQAGMPPITFDIPAPEVDSQSIASGKAFQGWLLNALEWSLDVQPAEPTPVVEASADAIAATHSDRAVEAASGAAAAASSGLAAGTTAEAVVEISSDAAMAAPSDSAAAVSSDASIAASPGLGVAPASDALAETAPAANINIDDMTPSESAAAATSIAPMAANDGQPTLRKLLTQRLRGWHRKVVKQGEQFAALDIPARHDLRKRGKRLRYGLQFAESVLPQTHLRSYRKQLSLVQDILGEINDLAMAKSHFQACIDTHPQAWFALGWITARLDKLIIDAQKAFDDLAASKPFWK